MTTYDLSILIPSRSEMFLAKTIENILKNIAGKTEIITVLDGSEAKPPLSQHERLTIVYLNQSVGQRAATNIAARLSRAKYLMKCDAHCSFDKGFDVKMMAEMRDDWTMVPLMKNLHAFDWVCPNGHRRYQGPSGSCLECGQKTTRDILWQAKTRPNSVSYCFDSTPHFQYFSEYAKRPEGQGEITETMSLQGSCWMLTRDKYFKLDVCDEKFGSWGSQGIEVAAKTWLSGGRVMVNKKTWYAHMFRTQGGDFGFPYPISGANQEKAKSFARDLFFGNKWSKQIHPLSWLIEKFWPVKGWTEADLKNLKANTFKLSPKSFVFKPAASEPTEESSTDHIIYSAKPRKRIVFYTDNRLNLKISHRVQSQLGMISRTRDIPIVSVSLKPMPHFGTKNIHLALKPSLLTMFKQILAGLKASTAEVIFFCEHDVLYHPSHFDFLPPKNDVFYYNTNVWKVRFPDGKGVHYKIKQLSGLCAYRDLLIAHYQERVRKGQVRLAAGLEPGAQRKFKSIDSFKAKSWKAEFPNIDIRHGKNLTALTDRWSAKEFKNKKPPKGWQESDHIPGWGSWHHFWRKLSLKQ